MYKKIKTEIQKFFLAPKKCSSVGMYILLLSFCINQSYAHEIKNSHFIQQGLPNRVGCILRDSKNYVWMGSVDGLYRFNGSELKTYRNDPNKPNSISNNRIRDIVEDADTNIWIATHHAPLCLYNRDDDSFIQFKNNPLDSTSISSDQVNCLFADKQHNLWIGVVGKYGLNKWNPLSKTFTHYQVIDTENNIQANSINSIVQDQAGNIWISDWRLNGLFRFEPVSKKFSFHTSDSLAISKTNKSLFVDNDNVIWISTFSFGLHSLDPTNNHFVKYNSADDGKGTNGTIVHNVIQEDDKHLLIAVDQGGINRYNKQTKSFEYIVYDPSNPNGLNNNGLWCVYKDHEGIIWAGTSGGGVNVYNPKSEKFKLIKNIPGELNSLIYNVVSGLYEDSKGLVWMNTDGGGVSVYNPLSGNFTNYKKDNNDPYSLPCNVVLSTVEDKNQDYWLGTWDGGLIKLDHKTNKFTQYLPGSNKPYNLSGRNVWHNMVDHNGIIWLSILGTGIDLLDPEKGIIKRFRANDSTKGTLNNSVVFYMYQDSHLNIWLCNSNKLSLFDCTTNSFKIIPVIPDRDMVSSIIEDKEGYYWAGTFYAGLIRFKLDGTVLKTYSTSNGLPDNTINGILEDNHHNIWISTNNGISRINYKTGSIRNYSASDGLQGKEYYPNSCLKTRSGEMYFGGYNGVNSFFPDSLLKDNDYLPPVYINEFLLFNKPVMVGQPNSLLKKAIEQTKEIVLNWKQSVFSLGFIALNYTHPEKNRYAYKMEGFDKDWNYTDANRRIATYTNLDAGKYTFRVKASNNDGIWNETGASIKIIILPPWWLTWWFKTLVVLLILSGFLSYYFNRVNRLKKQKEQLDSLVQQRTRQLNSQAEELRLISDNLKDANGMLEEQTEELQKLSAVKDKFFSIIAHDLRSPFSGFIGLTEIMADDLQSLTMDQIQQISNNMRNSASNIFNLMEDLLQWAKLQQSSIPVNPELLQLHHSVIEIVELLEELARNKGIKLVSTIPNDLTVFTDGNMLQTIVRNLVSNALKFTPQRGQISVTAKTNFDKNIEMSVKDTGIGMNREMVNNLFRLDVKTSRKGTEGEPGSGLGLILCKEFIEILGGEIWVESEEGKGTTFYFSLPNSFTSKKNSMKIPLK